MQQLARLETPFAKLLPPLSSEEFAALKSDIEEFGCRDPILIDEEGNILDGHHRYKINENIPIKIIEGLTTETHKKAFVIGCNFKRRNLSPSQKAEQLKVNKKIALSLKEEDTRYWTDKRIGELFGVARNTVTMWFTNNVNDDKAGKPDSRVKVNPQKKPEIAERIARGESQVQVAADLGVSQQTVSNIVTSEKKKVETKERQAKLIESIKTDLDVFCCDFREYEIEANSVGLIFTDPEYNKEAVSLYTDLAEFASQCLMPGGWLLAYSGHAHLPEVYKAFSETKGIVYAWTFCCLHSGGDSRFRKYKIHTGWKPIIAAYKPELSVTWEWFKDVVSGGREKDMHKWQQAESEAAYFIDKLTLKDAIVCDPFVGSGTTLVAAKSLDRRWIGFDTDKDTVLKAQIRLLDSN